MSVKACFLIVGTLFVINEAAFIDNLPTKCSIKDWDCQRDLMQTVLRDIGKSGIPDLDIPPIDPYAVKNVSISVLNLVDITMIDGVAKGVKDCVIDKFETEVEKEHATMEITCDLTIKGKYKADGSSPLIKNLLGGATVHAEGSAKVVLKKLHMRFDYHFYIRERDGEIYTDCRYEDLKYSYDFGKVTFAANGIFLGDNDATNVVIPFLNQNWKFIMESFGKPFMDKSMDIVYGHARKFFRDTPTRYYLTDDLTPYIKRD